MSDPKDTDRLVFSDAEPRTKPASPGAWAVLVVDDDEDVHRLTRLILGDKIIVGKRVELLFAWNAAEAEAILADREIACVLLDVVMETDDAGLRLVERIRDVLRNDRVRIIIRTGQPGRAPESAVIARYEINDYREKIELSAQKLTTAVTAAIRGFRDIQTIEQSRIGMRMIIDASAKIFQLGSLPTYASGVLDLFISLLRLREEPAFDAMSGLALAKEPSGYRILAGAGAYEGALEGPLEAIIGPEARALVDRALATRASVYADDRFVVELEDRRGRNVILYVEQSPPSGSLERELLDLSSASMASAFSNVMVYNELETLLGERSALLREIHHRVKNNLQIISSLISLIVSGPIDDPEETLLDVRDRIQSMAIVHDRVYDSEKLDTIDFGEVALGILDNALASAAPQARVRCDKAVEPATVPLAKAIPCALLFRELTVNALRHAATSPGAERVSIAAGPSPDGRSLEIAIRSGSPAGRNDLSSDDGIGTLLVGALVGQLKGRYAMSVADGLSIDLSVPLG